MATSDEPPAVVVERTLELTPQVRAFLFALERGDLRTVVRFLKDLRDNGRNGRAGRRVEAVRCERVKTFKANIYASELPSGEWRHGLRVIFRIKVITQSEQILHVIDVGDHTTCASQRGQSVYADERTYRR